MVEKLLLIAEKLPKFKEIITDKPQLAYQMGLSHAGSEDILELLGSGRDFICWFISRYPKEFLKEIIDHNGGLEAFCTTVVIPVKANLEADQNLKHTILDEKLKEYLSGNLLAS